MVQSHFTPDQFIVKSSTTMLPRLCICTCRQGKLPPPAENLPRACLHTTFSYRTKSRMRATVPFLMPVSEDCLYFCAQGLDHRRHQNPNRASRTGRMTPAAVHIGVKRFDSLVKTPPRLYVVATLCRDTHALHAARLGFSSLSNASMSSLMQSSQARYSG